MSLDEASVICDYITVHFHIIFLKGCTVNTNALQTLQDDFAMYILGLLIELHTVFFTECSNKLEFELAVLQHKKSRHLKCF